MLSLTLMFLFKDLTKWSRRTKKSASLPTVPYTQLGIIINWVIVRIGIGLTIILV